MGATPAWLASVEAVLNRELAASPKARALAAGLEGRSLSITASEIMTVRTTVVFGRLMLASDAARPSGPDAATSAGQSPGADARIEGSPFALLALFNQSAANPSASRAVQIRGDAEVASRFQTLFRALKPDLEELAAQRLGDLPAHTLARLSRSALGWAREAIQTGRRNVAEYLVEESRDLVNRTELDEFLRGVDQARESADRIEARLSLLERRRVAS